MGEIFATMAAGQKIILALSLLSFVQIQAAPKPFPPFSGEILETLGGLLEKIKPPTPTEYDAPPTPVEEETIPCHRRRKRDDSYGAPEAVDPCGVFQETDNYAVPDPSGGGKGKDKETNCKWVQATVFKTKYHTDCTDQTSNHCIMAYKTDCKDSVSYECKTDYHEECATTQVEECTTPEPIKTQVEECETIFKTETETVTEEVCTLEYEDVCTSSYGYSLNCVQVPKKTCKDEPKTIEKEVPEKSCKTVEKVVESEPVCVTVPKHTCNTVPVEECGNVPRIDCSLVAIGEDCKKVPERKCRQRPIQYPVTERKKVCDEPK